MTIHEHLESLNACDVAQKWASQYDTAQKVWDNCQRIDWLFWWAARVKQTKQVADAAKEIADSVKHLKNDRIVDWATDYAAYAADCAARAVNYAADYAANAAYYVASAADCAAYKEQATLNLQIARKHLVCPWHEDIKS